jgi:hypothetical protein
MSLVDLEQLADAGVLDEEDMQALLDGTADERIRRPAAAWLQAWRHARWLSFNETASRRQADAAWNRAAEEYAIETAIVLVEAN